MRRQCPMSEACGLVGCPVWGSGNPHANIMVVGEAPGKNEDMKGVPFIGKSGMELDKYLYWWAGIDRKVCYITNTVKCYTGVGDPDPTPDQVAICTSTWLEAEVERIAPRYIITAGRIATQWFLGGDVQMERVHGFGYRWKGSVVIPVFHPAYGLHATPKMRHIQADFKAVGEIIRGVQGVKELDGTKEEYGLWQMDGSKGNGMAITRGMGEGCIAGPMVNE